MKKTLDLIKNFEKRNNLSVGVTIFGDGSNSLIEFWEEEELANFDSIEALHHYLKNTQYLLAEDGRCVSPVQIV